MKKAYTMKHTIKYILKHTKNIIGQNLNKVKL